MQQYINIFSTFIFKSKFLNLSYIFKSIIGIFS